MEPTRSARINAAKQKIGTTIEGLGAAPPAAMILAKMGEGVVASSAFVPSMRLAGLERASRFAGEAFGHEEAAPIPPRRDRALFPSWALWLLAAGVAVIGLAALSLR